MLNSAEGMRARVAACDDPSARRSHSACSPASPAAPRSGPGGSPDAPRSSYDRFVAYEDASTIGVIGCPPGVTEDNLEMSDYQEVCASPTTTPRCIEYLAGVPGVESVGRWTHGARHGRPRRRPGRRLAPTDPGGDRSGRRRRRSVGRSSSTGRIGRSRPSRRGDRERGTRRSPRPRGRRRTADHAVSTDEFDIAGEGKEAPGGPATRGHRRRRDPPSQRPHRSRAGRPTCRTRTPAPSCSDRRGGHRSKVTRPTTPSASPQRSPLAPTSTSPSSSVSSSRVSSGWPSVARCSGRTTKATIVDAIDLQALGVDLMAVVVAAAGLLFAGQAVSRQTRREWADAPVLDRARHDTIGDGARRRAASRHRQHASASSSPRSWRSPSHRSGPSESRGPRNHTPGSGSIRSS